MQEDEIDELMTISLTPWCEDGELATLTESMGVGLPVAGQDGRGVSFVAKPTAVDAHICRPPLQDEDMGVQAIVLAAAAPPAGLGVKLS